MNKSRETLNIQFLEKRLKSDNHILLKHQINNGNKNIVWYGTIQEVGMPSIDVIWKPENGEVNERPGINGRFYAREAAAFKVAQVIRNVSVPVTVQRIYNNVTGALQKWLTAVPGDYINIDYMMFVDLDQWRWAAAYDYVIGNNDRHAGNFMVEGAGKLWLIDNGSSFPEENDCWRGSLAVLRPMINRRVKIPLLIKGTFKRSLPAVKHILNYFELGNSIESLVERVNMLSKAETFGDLRIVR